jgi:hypothetical protein
VGGFGLRNKTRFSEGRFLIVHPYSSASAQALVRASSSGSPGGEWQSAHPNAVVKETYTIENLPVDLSKPTGKFAPVPDLVSLRIGYEDSN